MPTQRWQIWAGWGVSGRIWFLLHFAVVFAFQFPSELRNPTSKQAVNQGNRPRFRRLMQIGRHSMQSSSLAEKNG